MLEVVLAKPQSEKKFDAANTHNPSPMPNYIPHPGYAGIPVNPYSPVAGGYGAAAGFQQVVNSQSLDIFNDLPHMFCLHEL